MRALGVRRRFHVVVEAVDEDAATAVDERVECVDDPPGRVRQVRGAARMRVALHRAHAQLDIEDALAAEEQLRPARGVDGAAFLQRAVAVGQSRVELEEAGEVRAAALLLSFYQEAHMERELAVDRAIRLECLDAQQEMSLVVIDPPSEDRAVTDRGVVGRRGPEVQGDRGLHVVVLHADEGAFARARLADDQRGRSFDPQLVRLRAGGGQTLATPACGRVERALSVASDGMAHSSRSSETNRSRC